MKDYKDEFQKLLKEIQDEADYAITRSRSRDYGYGRSYHTGEANAFLSVKHRIQDILGVSKDEIMRNALVGNPVNGEVE